jgi:hypothetical protein
VLSPIDPPERPKTPQTRHRTSPVHPTQKPGLSKKTGARPEEALGEKVEETRADKHVLHAAKLVTREDKDVPIEANG